jgi:hypothetical protein
MSSQDVQEDSMNRRMQAQKGEGKAGMIISLIVVAYLIFCGVRFVPYYIASYDLENTVRRQAEAATNKTEEQILRVILAKGVEHDMPMTEDNIQIKRVKRQSIFIKVEFTIPIDLALFTYNFHIDLEENRSLF